MFLAYCLRVKVAFETLAAERVENVRTGGVLITVGCRLTCGNEATSLIVVSKCALDTIADKFAFCASTIGATLVGAAVRLVRVARVELQRGFGARRAIAEPLAARL